MSDSTAPKTEIAGPKDAAAQGPKSDLIFWLWRNYLRRHTPILLLALVFMALEGSMLGALSWMMQPMFDHVFVAGQRKRADGGSAWPFSADLRDRARRVQR